MGERMNETVGQAMIYIADKLGIGIVEMTKIYASVQFGLSIQFLLQIIGVIIFITVCFLWIKRNYVKYNTLAETAEDCKARREAESKMESSLFIGGATLIIGTIIIYALIGTIVWAVLMFYFPEYGALQQMIGQFTSM